MTSNTLHDLKESQLREQILIPLFRAMGFQDVRHWHGGILEQGKDIVMWKSGDLGERLNYAVVVLAERISGQATGSGSAAKVASQLQQAFSSPIRDAVNGTQVSIDRAWVVTSHEIIKEAQESIENILRQSRLELVTSYISGDRLLQLLDQYLPAMGVLHHLQYVENMLQHSDPGLAVGVHVSQGKKSFWFESKCPLEASAAQDINIKYRIDDSPRGVALKAQLEKGETITIPKEFITEIEGPELAKQFLAALPAITFPGEGPKPLLLRLEVVDGNEIFYVIDRLTMSFRRQYEAGVVYSNHDDGAPWGLEIEICPDGRIHCRLKLTLKGLNAFEKLDQLRFQLALAKAKHIRLIDCRTGFDLAANTTIQMSGIEPPEPRWLAFIDMVAAIQRLSNTVIIVPNRTISAEEVQEVVKAHHVMTHGIVDLQGPFCLKVDRSCASQVIGIHERDEHFAVTQALGPESLSVMKTEIDLGMSVLYGEKIVPTSECVSELRGHSRTSDGETVELKLIAKAGSAFRRIFPKWISAEIKVPPEAEKALQDLQEQIRITLVRQGDSNGEG